MEKNVFGEPIKVCCSSPMTGYFRDGLCRTISQDTGTHTVCAVITDEFLKFSASKGNDLITPNKENIFPGLKEGDRWCLCAGRWFQAYKEGYAPKIILSSTSIEIIKYIDLEILKKFALDLN